MLSPLLLRHQGPMLATLGRVAVASLKGPDRNARPEAPGPLLQADIGRRPDELVEAYLAWSGGDPARYRGVLPPHFFPQWGFPLLSRTLSNLPYRLSGVLNQGCRVEVHGPVPRGETLRLQARLESVEDDGNKVRIHQRLITGTPERPELLLSDVFAVLVRKRGGDGTRRNEDAAPLREVGTWSADLRDGLRFGVLTGDMNPIHWVGPYAKAAGFKRQILHGFGSFARTWETVAAAFPGQEIRTFDVRFIRPVVLPAREHVLVGEPGDDGVRAVSLQDASGNRHMAGSVVLAAR